MKNIALLTDSYKVTHYKQYPPNTEYVYSYFESRGGEFPQTMLFGLQYYLMEYLEGVRVTEETIQEAKKLTSKHFGTDLFNESGWRYIKDKHGGKLPISIKAVPEGMLIPNSNVLMTVINTDPECYWLTNYLETLLVQCWYGSTVGTLSNHVRKTILNYLNLTGDPSLIDFKLHDFGFRGVSSVESAAVGGAAHLINFSGTDTLAALMFAQKYYDSEMAGYSIPAAEHSTITSWGKDNEVEAYKNMLDQYPTGPVAVVSDSYNIWFSIESIWGKQLKDKVLNRDGFVVIRPDSGDPVETPCEVIRQLGNIFGCKKNEKGFKVLDPHIRVIQGDGMDIDQIHCVYEELASLGYSADNLTIGMGGGLLQKINRDTQSMAFKCSAICKDGIWHDVYKNPVTDSGKASKRGLLSLVKDRHGKITTINELTNEDMLVEVFRDGEIIKKYTFDEVRKNREPSD